MKGILFSESGAFISTRKLKELWKKIEFENQEVGY